MSVHARYPLSLLEEVADFDEKRVGRAGCGGCGGLLFFEFRQKLVHGCYDKEVDRACGDQECNECIEECAVHEFAAVDGKHESRKIGGGKDRGDQGCEQVLHERRDDRAKRSTDDDAHGEVDDIAAEDKVSESGKHREFV